MNDRFKFRLPFYKNKGTFTHFQYFDILNGLDAYNAGVMHHNSEYEQCTGLKDKNGNLIYEGDIVRFEIVDDDSVLGKTFERICEICFGKGDYSYSFVCKNNAYYQGYALLSSILCQEIESIEIIGNIHEQVEQKDVK